MIYEIIDQHDKVIYKSNVFNNTLEYYYEQKAFWRTKDRFITIRGREIE